MKVEQNSLIARTHIVLVAVLLIASLLLVAFYTHEDENGALHKVQAVCSGASTFTKSANSSLLDLENGFTSAIEDAQASNESLEALRESNQKLTELLASAEEYRLESQRLQELLDFKEKSGVSGVSAHIIGYTSSSWVNEITLDVGSSDGVSVGLSVVGQGGLIGQVVRMDAGSCDVRLLQDPQSGVAVMVQSNREQGVLKGSYDGLLYLENIDSDVEVLVGDVITTSGLGGSFVKGLEIGTVSLIRGSTGESNRTIVVTPNTSLSNIEEVIVVASAKEES